MVWLYKHLIGDLLFDNNYRLIPSRSVNSKHTLSPSPQQRERMLICLRVPCFHEKLIEANKKKTLADLQIPCADDSIALHLSKTLQDMKHHYSKLGVRLREWIGEMAPEAIAIMLEPAKLAALILTHTPENFYDSIHTTQQKSPGGKFSKQQYQLIKNYAQCVADYKKSLDTLEQEQRVVMTRIMPNTCEVLGVNISVKLLERAGSLRRLMLMSAGTIQLLGAEEALFRHLKDPKRYQAPKHGAIFDHPLIAQAKRNDRGKAARALADKTIIALRVDYFHGQPIGKKLIKELEARFS